MQLASQDAADVAAVILADPAPHVNKTYSIMGPSWTKPEAAAAFTAELGRPIEYEHVSYEAMEKGMAAMGMPPWQIAATQELNHLINAERCVFHSDDFTRLTGREPTSVQTWIKAHASEFA